MRRGLFVTGTDTEIGKTVVASVLAASISRRERKVGLWKPVQTGVEAGSPEADSSRLVAGSGLLQAEAVTASITFPDPVAPWMAAQRAGMRISFQQLVDEGQERLRANDFTVVEGAGGLAVPLTDRHLVSDLAAALKLPLVIVARPGLGTVNHTLLTVAYARTAGLEVLGVILNGYKGGQEAAMQENAMMIERFGDVPVIGKLPWLPYAPQTDEEWTAWRERWIEIVDAEVDVERLLRQSAAGKM